MQTNKDIKEVVDCFNMYQNDSDIDFLTIILDKKTDEVHTGYHVNGYSDDLAECFSETIEQSPNFAQFIAKILGRCSTSAFTQIMVEAQSIYNSNQESMDKAAKKDAYDLFMGNQTFDDINKRLVNVKDDDVHEYHQMLLKYYKQYLKGSFNLD